jgi:hypothetical protein
MAFGNLDLLAKADADAIQGLRGRIRTLRRLMKRSILDSDLRKQKRFFCQNSGACGSHYIVDLLVENSVQRVFHEKDPDLNEIGVKHYESGLSQSSLIRTLRYTRHNVFFEANNRLFSLSTELAAAFPGAAFIHLFRHPADAVRSAMSKPNVEEYLRSHTRFAGKIAGSPQQRTLERFCHYWANVNRRILDDLKLLDESGKDVMWLNFADLGSGNISRLESFIGHELTMRQRSPSHVGAVRKEGKFESFENWSDQDQKSLNEICLSVYQQLLQRSR